MARYGLIGLLLFTSAFSSAFADTSDDPCGGPYALLSLVNRPTWSDSACVVPDRKMIVEMGYTYQQLLSPNGYGQNYPQTQIRFGLPWNTEITTTLPNYYKQTSAPHAGFGTTTLQIKHAFIAINPWVVSAEADAIFPTGSASFGSADWGSSANIIVYYVFSPVFSMSFIAGASTLTQAKNSGGKRFNSINPDVVASYNLTSRTVVYSEYYYQTKPAAQPGSGSFIDAGFIYLLKPAITMDIEIGQKVSGRNNIGGFTHYIGSGIAFML